MGDFFDYVEKERQKQNQMLKQEQEQNPVYKVEDKLYVEAEDDIELAYQRYALTSFEERSKYYFDSKQMIDQKEAKYLSLSGFKNRSLNKYAKTHNNRGGYKRKKRAKEASLKFKEAGVLALQLEQKREDYQKKGINIPHKDEFDLRKAILEKRLEAMKKAAEAKSTGEADEKYRKAKADLKINLMLLDLSKRADSLNLTDYISELVEKIKQAEREMHQYGEGRADGKWTGEYIDWKSDNPSLKMDEARQMDYWRRKEERRETDLKRGHDTSKYIKSFEDTVEEGKIRKADFDEHFNEEDYKVYKSYRMESHYLDNPQYNYYFDSKINIRFQNDISRLGGCMLRPVKFDEKWQPVSTEDMENHIYNLTLCKHIVKTREGDEKAEESLTNAMNQELEKVYKESPEPISPEEIEEQVIKPLRKQKSFKNLSPKCLEDMAKNPKLCSEMALRSLTIEGVYKFLPKVKEYVDKNKVIDAYFDVVRSFSIMVQFYMTDKYSVNPKYGHNASLEYVPAQAEMFEFYLEDYKKNYNAYMELKNQKNENKA